MAKMAITDQYLTDIADAIRSKTGMSSKTYYPSEMAPAILSISGSGGIIPTGTINITSNNTYDVTQYASANVNVPNPSTGTLTITANDTYDVTNYASAVVDVPTGSTINNQNKSVTPSESQQTVNADAGYTGLGTVTVGAIDSDYVGSGISRKDSTSLTVSGATVTAPAGYYASNASKSVSSMTLPTAAASSATSGYTSKATIGRSTSNQYLNIPTGYNATASYYTISATPNGTAGTPTVTKGTVSNNSISITPSVTNTTGYITGGTIAGTAVSVSASELVSGTLSITSNGTKDVTNYASVNVNVPTGGGTTINNQNKTVTPTTSEQYITADSGYTGLGTVTVEAMPIADPLVDAISGYSTVSGQRKWSFTPNASAGVHYGYDAGYFEGTVVGNEIVYNAIASNTTITPSNSTQTIGGANTMMEGPVTVSAMPTGVTTSPTSISGTAATVSTGTNTLTLTKTVSVTPRVTTAGYVSAGTAGNSSVSLTANVTTKAAATITPSTSNQTIASGTYLTGTQTISGDANLIADNIKSGTIIFGVTGTYEGSGSGSSMTVATTTKTLTSAASSIQFTGLAGEPTSFAVVSASDLTTGASPWKTAAVVFDGSSLHGQTITNTSNAQVSYDGTGFSKTYSNGTLTITGTNTNFQANQYKLVYTYGGSVSNIGTSDVQVGSGVTSITFTGIESEPEYFSCIFKSNFSTSNGYQRVIVVVYDGTSIYGMLMDSSAKANTTHWSYSYNNNSLVITSSGTNAGGYFHQPGYYQLTYALPGADDGLQTKTVTPTTSIQNVIADTGYTGLKKVVVNAIPSTYIQPTATKGATTYTPGTSNQTIASGTYLTGTQTIAGDANLIGSNIISTASIFGVQGTVVLQNCYTGSTTPSSSLGNNGDIYLQT